MAKTRARPTEAAPVVEPAEISISGDRTLAFATFYGEHYSTIARGLSITLGDQSWGREATDEAMTRAYDKWDEVGGYSNPQGWVYRVGLNYARSWHRRLNRKLPWSVDEVALPETPDVALEAALRDLDIKYRSVVVCRYLLDWTTEQTAEALDLASGTVKSRLSVGLDRLRNTLEETPSPAPSPASSPDNGTK